MILELGPRLEPAFVNISGKNYALTYEGEVRFGPAYCSLRVGALSLAGRVFSSRALVSDDGCYVLAEEWYSRSERDGPDLGIVLFDVKRATQAVLQHQRSFSELVSLNGKAAVYRHSGMLETTTHIERVDNWEHL